jgi:hypothetical protein
MFPQTPLNVSNGSQKSETVASLPNVPTKTGTTVLRESPCPQGSKSRQGTLPSSGIKKAAAPLPASPPPGNSSKTQGFLRATRGHRTSCSSSKPELVPVVKKSDEIPGYENMTYQSKMDIRLYNRVPDIIPPIQDRNKKDKTSAAASGIGNNHNGSNSVMSSVAKELETPDLIQSFANNMSDSVSQTAKSARLPDDLGAVAFPDLHSTNGTFAQTKISASPIAPGEAFGSANFDTSTMEEQENVVSSACNSLLMSEHHHLSEKEKEYKEHKLKVRHKNREERKHKHKGKCKDIWRSELIGPGLKMKFWRVKGGSNSRCSSPQSVPSGGLKIKLTKEVTGNFNNSNAGPPGYSSEVPSSSRKPDRSIPQSSELVPPAKIARLNTSSGEKGRNRIILIDCRTRNAVDHRRT